jgi:hypothetical protein
MRSRKLPVFVGIAAILIGVAATVVRQPWVVRDPGQVISYSCPSLAGDGVFVSESRYVSPGDPEPAPPRDGCIRTGSRPDFSEGRERLRGSTIDDAVVALVVAVLAYGAIAGLILLTRAIASTPRPST